MILLYSMFNLQKGQKGILQRFFFAFLVYSSAFAAFHREGGNEITLKKGFHAVIVIEGDYLSRTIQHSEI